MKNLLRVVAVASLSLIASLAVTRRVLEVMLVATEAPAVAFTTPWMVVEAAAAGLSQASLLTQAHQAETRWQMAAAAVTAAQTVVKVALVAVQAATAATARASCLFGIKEVIACYTSFILTTL